MRAKRIAIVANSTWNIYNFRLNIIRKLLDEGHQVIVLAPLDEYIGYQKQFPGLRHISLRQLDRSNTNPFKDFRLFWELKTIYKKIKPDLILHYTHKPNIYGGLAAKWTRVRSIAVVTGLGYAFIHHGWTHRITKYLYSLAGKMHDKMIFENSDDLNLFVNEKLVDVEKAYAIKGCGVDTAVYLPHPNGREGNKIIFTFIGRLLYDKGIVEFVEAARILKSESDKAEFHVAGQLDQENPSMVGKELFLGWIEKGVIVYHGFMRDIRPVIAQSDCVALPSYREGMPRIILEAMSMAKPVVTSRTAGCRETVREGENGFLVEVGNVQALAAAMRKMMEMPAEERQEMGKKGREMAIREFNSEKIAAALHEIIMVD